MCEIFLERDCLYSLKDIINNQLYKSTVKYGIDSIVHKGPQIWQTLPADLRNSEPLSIFKCNITLGNSGT